MNATQEIRRSAERGYADHGWLKSFHTFSFADYFDPRHVEFGPLRVINEDRVAAGAGFGTHPHRDMEIISYVLAGELSHKDSLGNGSTIRPGDVQRMSAGTGVRHSEFNPSSTAGTHFLQIWIQPSAPNIEPSYEEKRFSAAEKRGRLRLIVSPDRTDGSVLIHQDARVYAGLFDGNECAEFALAAGRRAYVHVARGTLSVNGVELAAGDALKIKPSAGSASDSAGSAVRSRSTSGAGSAGSADSTLGVARAAGGVSIVGARSAVGAGHAANDGTTVTLEQGKDAEVLVFDLPGGH